MTQMPSAQIDTDQESADILKTGLLLLKHFIPRKDVEKIAEGIRDGEKRIAANKTLPSPKEAEALKLMKRWSKETGGKLDQ